MHDLLILLVCLYLSCTVSLPNIPLTFLHPITPFEHPSYTLLPALIIAGHETTSNQLTWIMIELARHPDVLRKGELLVLYIYGVYFHVSHSLLISTLSLIHVVQRELDLAFPDPSDICDEQKFMKADLTYLSRVINEAMRLNPVIAGGVAREMAEDMEYEGMLLPKGSTVVLHMCTMFHSHISQPDEFLPDRWDEAHPEYALLKSLFIPFSLGKRNCIGMNLALLETR